MTLTLLLQTVPDSLSNSTNTNTYDELVSSLSVNPWFIIIGFIIGILGLGFAIYSHFNNKKKKKLCYMVTNFTLVREELQKIKGLNITYKDEAVKNLSVARLSFWNNGTEILRKADIPEIDAIRVYIMGQGKIYECKTISPKLANNIKTQVSENRSSISIDFDYLNPNDGTIIQLYHSSNNVDHIVLKGELVGIKEFERLSNNELYSAISTTSKSFVLFNFFLKWIAIPLCLIFLIYMSVQSSDEPYSFKSTFISILPTILTVYTLVKLSRLKSFKNYPNWLKKIGQ